MENSHLTKTFINKMRSKRQEILVRKKVAELPTDERTTIYLKFWEQLETQEIAQSLNRSNSDIEKTLKSALMRLKNGLIEVSSDFEQQVELSAA